MSLRFRYKLIATKHPVISLDGRMVRPRPLILVSLIGPAGAFAETVHLDSASDDCVFPAHAAAKIGIDLTNAPTGEAAGIGIHAVSLRYAPVTVRVAGSDDHCEWRAWVAFTDAPLNRPLLGFAGFLQFFNVTFRGGDEEVHLAPNNQFPGAVV